MDGHRTSGQPLLDLSETDALRRQSFRILVVTMVLAGWLGLQAGYSVAPVSGYMWLGVLCMIGGAYVAYLFVRRSFQVASVLLVLTMALSLSSFILAFPQLPMRFFLVLVPLAGTLVMSQVGAWISLALALSSLAATEFVALGAAGGLRDAVAPIGLQLLTFGLAMLLSRSFRTAAAWASQHQRLAQQRAEDARARRAELARAFKALDEAWHRLERMNNELIHARAEAEEARRAKAEFAAHISHELRTPLNIILGFSRMMFLSPESYDGEPLPPVYRGDMQAIFRGSQYLSNLVDDILDLARAEAGRLTISPRRLNLLHDVVEEIASIVRSLADAKGLELRVEVGEELSVQGDPIRLRQVLLNLVNNAIRFTEQGHVAIRAESDSETVTLSVEDTGRGMDPEDVEKAFDAFQQVWSAGEPVEGTGLGLAISRGLVELHGGRIWADSAIGEGTRVHVTLPGVGDGPLSGAARSRAHRWSWPEPTREEEYCVVVSPDPLTVQALERHLTGRTRPAQGCQMFGVAAAEDIGAAVEQLHPRVIVVDQRVGQDAVAIAETIPYDVPIVTCSVPSEAEVSLSMGAVGHLRKPIEEQVLLKAVEDLGPDVETILIVDDDPWMVRLLGRMLATAPKPYRLLEAFDGDEALELMRGRHPQAALLDIVMQGKDGFDVLREMKSDEDLAAIPVIMISGAGRSHGEASGFSQFTVVRRGQLGIEEIAESLRAVLTSMPADYLSREPIAHRPAEAPAG